LPYTKTVWADGENRYDIKTQASAVVSADIKLVYVGTGVGTAISATVMNNLEQGVYDAYNGAYLSALFTARGMFIRSSAANTPEAVPLDDVGKVLCSDGIDIVYDYAPTAEYAVGDTVLLTANTNRGSSSGSFTTLKTFRANRGGYFRVKGQFSIQNGTYGRVNIFSNGVDVTGTYYRTDATIYQNFSIDTNVYIPRGSAIDVCVRSEDGIRTASVQNVTLCGILAIVANSVITD
jgi:hypothetical protein